MLANLATVNFHLHCNCCRHVDPQSAANASYQSNGTVRHMLAGKADKQSPKSSWSPPVAEPSKIAGQWALQLKCWPVGSASLARGLCIIGAGAVHAICGHGTQLPTHQAPCTSGHRQAARMQALLCMPTLHTFLTCSMTAYVLHAVQRCLQGGCRHTTNAQQHMQLHSHC
jgi:hypothetical protein